MIKDNFISTVKDKISFIQMLSEDNKLAQCLLSSKPNFEDIVVNNEDRNSLGFTRIFPYYKIIDTQANSGSYITMKFRYRRVKNQNIYKVGTITFYLLCHESDLRTDYEALRYDYMLQRLNELINDSRSEQWIGKMVLESTEDIIVDKNYMGVMAIYTNTEFM